MHRKGSGVQAFCGVKVHDGSLVPCECWRCGERGRLSVATRVREYIAWVMGGRIISIGGVGMLLETIAVRLIGLIKELVT